VVGKTQTPQPSMFQQAAGYVLGNAGQAMKVFGGGGGMGGQGFY
jgi:hypothetical protein